MISGVSCAAEAAARQVLSNLGLAYSEKGDFDNSARYYRDAYWQVQLLCARLAAEQLVQLSGFFRLDFAARCASGCEASISGPDHELAEQLA